MNYEDARQTLVDLLRERRKARNSELIEAVGGDHTLFDRIREDLIFNDVAEDKKGAGLVWLGPSSSEVTVSPTTEGADSADLETARRRIFISYGRADAFDLAAVLEHDLSQRGHTIWLDRSGLAHGRSWEQQIEDAILSHEIFISLLTPHAVRRPDGVCLDEISLARYNNRRIIPAMVLDCRQPLGIYRLNWIDFHDWRNPGRYDRALRDLLVAIERNAEIEGLHARIFSNLKPLDFGLEIAHWSRDFTGREWLFERLEAWLGNAKSRIFFITGDPGTGKSAVLARLVDRNPRVIAYHFCVSSLADSLDPIRFVRSIAAQLATQLPGYRSALDAVDLEHVGSMDASSSFRRLIAEPLQAESGDHPGLIVIDALDEAILFGERNIATVLRDRLDDLPSWVKLVISSREQPEIFDMFSAFDPEPIRAGSAENLEDIDSYVARRLEEPSLAVILDREQVDAGSCSALIKRRSEGNFLYVTQLMRGIESGRWNPAEPDRFPSGLVGIYQSFFERLFPGASGFDEVRPLLSVVAAARETLSPGTLAAFVGRDTLNVERAMQKLASFFPRRDGTYHVYHKSILDWLSGSAGSNTAFRIQLDDGHRRISAALANQYRAGKIDRFLLSHWPSHLVGGESWPEAEELLTDLGFIAAKSSAGMIFELARDFDHALDNLPEGREQQERMRRHGAEIAAYVRNLVSFSRGESTALAVPASTKPLDEEQIHRANHRILSRPSRLDRIRAFAQFWSTEAHRITRFSGHEWYCAQQAWNFADSGPVADAARKLLEAGAVDKILLKSEPFLPAYNPHSAEIRTFEGHASSVLGVAVTADGRRAVSGGEDGEVRVWDVSSGECVAVLRGHEARVNGVAVTPDGGLALTASDDRTVRVWDLKMTRCRSVLQGHTAPVRAVDVVPDGRKAVSGGSDRTVRVWNLESATCVAKLSGHRGEVSCAKLSADGRIVVSGSRDRSLRVWDCASSACTRVLNGHAEGVRCLALTPDGRRAVSGGADRTLIVWDLESGRPERVLAGHNDRLRSVSMSADGRIAISGSGHSDQVIRLWDADSGRCLRMLPGHTDSVKAVAITPDGRLAVSGSGARDRTVKAWNLVDGFCAPPRPGHTGGVWSVTLDPECRVAVTCAGANDGALKVWDLSTGRCERVLEGHSRPVWSVKLDADNGKVVSGSKDKTVRVWDLATAECRRVLSGHEGDVWSVAVFPDGRHIMSASGDATLALWDLENQTRVRIFHGHTDEVWSLVVLPDLLTAVSGSKDQSVRLWNLKSGRCLRVFGGHTEGVWSVAVAPDGRTLFSASLDRTVRIWDTLTGECRRILQSENGVLHVACTPNGRWLATTSYDKTLRMWDTARGLEVAALPEASAVTGASEIRQCGRLVYGTAKGSVVAVSWKASDPMVPLVTAQLLGGVNRIDSKDGTVRQMSVLCERCGKRFTPASSVADALEAIKIRYPVARSGSPCLDLPDHAWNEAALSSVCSVCQHPVQFNPFLVDFAAVAAALDGAERSADD